MKEAAGQEVVVAENSVVAGRIARLREAMAQAGVGACVVPSSDPHVSEYPPAHWALREWMSGFSGSVGTLVVTAAEAGLWVDFRYWEQAGQQLAGSGIAVMRQGQTDVPGIEAWLARSLDAGASVAVDGAVLAWSEAQSMRRELDAHGIALRTDLDLVSPLVDGREPLPATPVREQALELAGESRGAKLARLRERMQERGSSLCFLSALDDIAWLFNLRGADVPYNPVFLAHALVSAGEARLFVGADKLPTALRERLAQDGVRIEPYAGAREALAKLPATESILIDPERTVAAMIEALPAGLARCEGVSPVVLMKARKNPVEQAHVRAAMEFDGAALCRFMCWFDEVSGSGSLDEITLAERLREERARQPGFLGESFGTIAAFRANGALPHYRAEPGSAARIEGDGILLLDSGGQYPAATTDITRMLPVGTPPQAHRKDCALVLRGLIALSRAAFPAGIGAPLIDAIARAPLWAEGIDYGHGTGHGVGCHLHVHEAPQRIAIRARITPHNTMEEGMITSIEPGIYRPGRWGVRIENLVLARTAAGTEFGNFLAFETLTLCPIDLRCIDTTLLRADEIEWLDAYHREVRSRLAPLLDGSALDWLNARTAPVAEHSC